MSNDGLAGAAAGLRGGGSVRSVRVALVSSNSLLVAESATPDNNLSELIATLPNPFSALPLTFTLSLLWLLRLTFQS